MSIILIDAERDRIRIVVDSLTIVTKTDSESTASKLQLLPLQNMVVAGRGSDGVPLLFSVLVQHMRCDFDALLPQALGVMENCLDQLAAQAVAFDQKAEFDAMVEEIVIAGYSAQRGRLAAFTFAKGGSGAGREIQGIASAPSGANITRSSHPLAIIEDGDLRRMSRQLIERCCELRPKSAGGKLLLAEVTRDQTTVRSLGT